jgi:hypothetical protein
LIKGAPVTIKSQNFSKGSQGTVNGSGEKAQQSDEGPSKSDDSDYYTDTNEQSDSEASNTSPVK